MNFSTDIFSGSSPQVRGRSDAENVLATQVRLIPAGAGQIQHHARHVG
ncbi:hypothetical protein HMPREF0294_0587 [Corynebacterium glucuronolyticum ATCC 51867]|nr:hypothetical protein HMPREF0294_0587 [Corynebacterium glucuronolyticum ATCC 51867]